MCVAREGRITGLEGNVSRQDKLGFEPLAPASVVVGPGSQGRAWKLVEAVHARCVMGTTSRPDVLVRANDM